MARRDFTDEVLNAKYLNACILESRGKTCLRIWAVDHKPELAMSIQEIYDMVKSYRKKPTIACPDPGEPFMFRYIEKSKLLAKLAKRLEEDE